MARPYDYCPQCDEPDPIFYSGEGGEPSIQTCPECGWEANVDEDQDHTDGAS